MSESVAFLPSDAMDRETFALFQRREAADRTELVEWRRGRDAERCGQRTPTPAVALDPVAETPVTTGVPFDPGRDFRPNYGIYNASTLRWLIARGCARTEIPVYLACRAEASRQPSTLGRVRVRPADIARDLGLSRKTVRNVLSRLTVSRGVLARQGRDLFVLMEPLDCPVEPQPDV